MNEETDQANPPKKIYGRPMTRKEIVRAVTDPDFQLDTEKKIVTIASSTSSKADFQETAKDLNVAPGSLTYRILQKFCEEKKATRIHTKVLMARIKTLADEQLKILELVCGKNDFTAKTILNFIHSLKKFGSHRLLILRAFTDLEGVNPGSLHQFITTALPQSQRETVGDEAYENELLEKVITPDQITVFYNICHQITGITPRTAIAVLPKTRQLKPQHAQFINTFMGQDVFFGEKPIGNDNILGFLNLWLSLPELNEEKKHKKLIRMLSRLPDSRKKNFQILIHFFKEETKKEEKKEKPAKNIPSGIRKLFS